MTAHGAKSTRILIVIIWNSHQEVGEIHARADAGGSVESEGSIRCVGEECVVFHPTDGGARLEGVLSAVPGHRILIAVGGVGVVRGTVDVEAELQIASIQEHLGWAGGKVRRILDPQLVRSRQVYGRIVQRVVISLGGKVKLVYHRGRNHFRVGDVAEIIVELVVTWISPDIRRAILHKWVVEWIVESNQGDGETIVVGDVEVRLDRKFIAVV